MTRVRLSSFSVLLLGSLASAQLEDLGARLGQTARGTLISADGRVVAGHTVPHPYQAFRFSDGVGQEFLLALQPESARPNAISADGRYIAGSLLSDRAMRWGPDGQPLDLGSIGEERTRAYDISADGSTVVGFGVVQPGAYSYAHAFRWTQATGMVDIHLPMAPTHSFAVATSDDGSVVVGYASVRAPGGGAVTDLTATVWTEATGTFELMPNSGLTSACHHVSDDGRTIAGIMGPTGTMFYQAFVWTAATGVVPLGPPPTQLEGISTYLSADGSTVFGERRGIGFRWTAATGYQEFTGSQVFDPRGGNADGTVLVGFNDQGAVRWTVDGGLEELEHPPQSATAALAVSADGDVIVGNLSRPTFETRAVRWRLDGTIGRPAVCDPPTGNSAHPGGGRMTLGGTNMAVDRSLVLNAFDLPPHTFGFFLTSKRRTGATQPVGSEGNLCLGGAIGRYVGPVQILDSGPNGAFSLTVDPNLFPSPSGPVAAEYGETRYFQAWYRDANPAPTSNFTGAMQVRIY